MWQRGRRLLILLQKEWRLELRGKEAIIALFCHTILLSSICASGVSSAVLDSVVVERIFPMLLWIVFLVTATLACARGFEHELEGRAYEALLVDGISGAEMFTAKVFVQALFCSLAFVVAVVILGTLLGVSPYSQMFGLALLGISVSVGFSSLAVVVGTVASTSRLKGTLVPLLLLPLLFPLFFSGVELSSQMMDGKVVTFDSPWIALIVCADAVYFLAGLNLYEFVIRE